MNRQLPRTLGVDSGFAEYGEQLAALQDRLNNEAFAFFSEADVHDGELLELRLIDGIRPAPLSDPARVWKATRNYRVKAEQSVLDAMDQFVWQLSYQRMRRARIDFPG